MLKMTGVKLEKISDIGQYLFIEKEVEYLMSLKDMLKQIINTRVIMTRINHQHLLLIWIKITYMAGQ